MYCFCMWGASLWLYFEDQGHFQPEVCGFKLTDSVATVSNEFHDDLSERSGDWKIVLIIIL